jgi:hypothetical protein
MTRHPSWPGLAVSILLAAFLLVVGVLWVLPAVRTWLADPITETNVRRVKEGMPREEVQRLLGWPTKKPRMMVFSPSAWPESWSCEQWTGRGGVVTVYFDSDEKAVHVRFSPAKN